jgi:hypothetical protein
MSRAVWRKSSYSGSNGGACVEIMTLDAAAWRKSTRSGNGGDCVEITGTGRVIAVRDSKDPSGPHLDFTPRQWHSFVVNLKS